MLSSRALIHAWLLLLVLSAATTLLTLVNVNSPARSVVGATVLILAGSKARVILARYLGLDASCFWTRVFDMALGFFLVLAFALYAFGTKG
jgi:hypothetical protein